MIPWFNDTSAHFEEGLEYPLVYFEKNTEALLYAQAYSNMIRYDEKSYKGPLLFKLVCNEKNNNKRIELKKNDYYHQNISNQNQL